MDRMLLALVNNQPETLMRVTGLIRRRGYIMKKISMVEASDSSFAYLTAKIKDENRGIEQIIDQIKKLVDVHKVEEINHKSLYKRETPLFSSKTYKLKSNKEGVDIMHTDRKKVENN